MQRRKTYKNNLISVCLLIIVIIMLSIIIRFFTRQILIVKLGVDNTFTQMVFFDNSDMASVQIEENNERTIDWSQEYPFSSKSIDEDLLQENNAENAGILNRYKNIIASVEERINNYAQDELVGYHALTWLGNKYKQMIDWNFASFSEYNGTFKMEDGYWTSLNSQYDQTDRAGNLVSFGKFCQEKGAEFAYVQLPHKISEVQDTDLSGVVDFTNQNANQVLSIAKQNNIHTFDIREDIQSLAISNHSLFYITDHHWKAETGLWATEKIAEYVNKEFDYNLDTSRVNIKNYDSVNYEKTFLGSYGTKVTTAVAEPEDCTMLLPAFDTSVELVIPTLDLDQTGDFSVFYDMEKAGTYAAYGFGDHAVKKFINHSSDAIPKKILVIQDSFSDAICPFFALTVSEIDTLDLRYFNGSVRSYVDTYQPDLVLVLRYAGEIATVREDNTHADAFDFR